MALLSPGVQTREIDLSLVAANSGSTNGAFGGKFHRGYAGKAVLITNIQELKDNFGLPSNENFNDWFQAYYYLQYSNNLYISRAVDENGFFTKTESEVEGTPNIGKVMLTGNPDKIFVGSKVKFADDSEDEYQVKNIELPSDGQVHKQQLTINTAVVGDYAVNIQGNAFIYTAQDPDPDTDPLTTTKIAAELSALIDIPGVVTDSAIGNTILIDAVNPGVTISVEILNGDMTVETIQEPLPVENYELVFDDETDFTDIAPAGSPVFVKGQSCNAFKFVPRAKNEEDPEPEVPFPVPNATDQIAYEYLYKNEDEYDIIADSIPFIDNNVLKFIARGFGEYGNNIKVAIAREDDFKNISAQVIPGIALNTQFEYKPLESKKEIGVIVLEDDIIKEKFLVSLDPEAKDYQNRTMYIEDVFRRKSNYLYCKHNTAIIEMPASHIGDNVIKLSNGFTGEIGMSEIINAYGSVSDSTIFGDTEGLDIDYIIANETARTAAGSLAQNRQDCLAVIGAKYDIVGQKSTKIVELLLDDVNQGEIASGSTRNSYCAYFGNYAQIWDQYNDKYRWISVAGMVAGKRAQTTYELYPWYASAGETQGQLKDVIKWAFSPNVGARDKMYVAQINSIVRFPGRGDQVYGQKTLQAQNSAFSRINVRLLFNYIKRNLGITMRSFVFELNDSFTRNRVEAACSQFLDRIQTLRGLYEFGVACNENNNPPQVIDNNELVCDIALKPTRVAEFIYLNLYCLGSDVSISEVLK